MGREEEQSAMDSDSEAEKEMDCRRKEEEWERSIEEVASNQ